MPRGREPEGQIALTNAERQARYRARRPVEQPPVAIKQPRPPRRSRTEALERRPGRDVRDPGRVRRVVRSPA